MSLDGRAGRAATASRWIVAASVGGVACFVGDHGHVAAGVLAYPEVAFWGQAWWVLPLFVAASALALVGVRAVHPGGRDAPGDPVRQAVADGTAFLAAYGLTAAAQGHPDLLVVALVGLWLLRVHRGMPRRLAAFCLLSALVGTSWEAMWSGIGRFHYLHPDLLGVPRWLPALYLHAALVADSARRVVDGNRAIRT